MKAKILNRDGFLWLDVTQKAGAFWDVYELYQLHEDGSESLIDDEKQLVSLVTSLDSPSPVIAIELCFKNELS